MSLPWTHCYPRCCLPSCFSSWGVKSTRRRCGVVGVRGGVHSQLTYRVLVSCVVLCCAVLCCAVPQERKDLPRAVLKKIGKTEHEQVRHNHAAQRAAACAVNSRTRAAMTEPERAPLACGGFASLGFIPVGVGLPRPHLVARRLLTRPSVCSPAREAMRAHGVYHVIKKLHYYLEGADDAGKVEEFTELRGDDELTVEAIINIVSSRAAPPSHSLALSRRDALLWLPRSTSSSATKAMARRLLTLSWVKPVRTASKVALVVPALVLGPVAVLVQTLRTSQMTWPRWSWVAMMTTMMTTMSTSTLQWMTLISCRRGS